MRKIAPYTTSELRFGQDFPDLEASRLIGSISVEKAICSYCEQEILIPTDPLSKKITTKQYKYGIGNLIEYDDLIFCSVECQNDYIIAYDIERFTCTYCKEDIIGEAPNFREIYDSPYDIEPEYHDLCEHCLDYFHTFVCGWCDREIRQENSNGHIFYRKLGCSIVCLECYEAEILESGLPIDSFDGQRIDGMFFSNNNNEPLSHGWEKVEGYDHFFIRSDSSIEEYHNKAIELIREGWLVVTGYESLSIMGDEGYVTMFKKKGDSNV